MRCSRNCTSFAHVCAQFNREKRQRVAPEGNVIAVRDGGRGVSQEVSWGLDVCFAGLSGLVRGGFGDVLVRSFSLFPFFWLELVVGFDEVQK